MARTFNHPRAGRSARTLAQPEQVTRSAGRLAAPAIHPHNCASTHPALRPGDVLALQRSIGNRAVARMLRSPAPQPAAPARPAGLLVQRALSYTLDQAQINYVHPGDEDIGMSTHAFTINRPAKVEGVVKSGKRGPTPDPLAVVSLAEAYCQERNKLKNLSSTVTKQDVIDQCMKHGTYDRGHLIAAEMGGEDNMRNIVPQWSLNQQSGEWRQMEVKTYKQHKGAKITVTPTYSRETGLWQGVTVPSSINYKVEKKNKPVIDKNWNNVANANDLLVVDAEEAAIEEKQYIIDFLASNSSSKISGDSLLNNLPLSTKIMDSMSNYVDLRNRYGESKRKKAKPNKKKARDHSLNLLKQMALQGIVKPSKVVHNKTKKEELKKLVFTLAEKDAFNFEKMEEQEIEEERLFDESLLESDSDEEDYDEHMDYKRYLLGLGSKKVKK